MLCLLILPSSLTSFYKVKDFKSHFFQKQLNKIFLNSGLSCPNSTLKKLVKLLPIFSFWDITEDRSDPCSSSESTVVKLWGPIKIQFVTYPWRINFLCKMLAVSCILYNSFYSARLNHLFSQHFVNSAVKLNLFLPECKRNVIFLFERR